MSQQWMPVNSSRTEEKQQKQAQQETQQETQLQTQRHTQQETSTPASENPSSDPRKTRRYSQAKQTEQQAQQQPQQETPTPTRKRPPSDPSKTKLSNEQYKTRKYNQAIEKWGSAGTNLAKEYLIHHPQRLNGRRFEDTTESEWASFLPHDWTYKLFRVANAVPNYERGIEYIRYQVYHCYGSTKFPTLFPSASILDKVYEMISSGSDPEQITGIQLRKKGLKVGRFGLLELDDVEGGIGDKLERRKRYKGHVIGEDLRSLRSRSAINNETPCRSSTRQTSQAATRLVEAITEVFSNHIQDPIEDASDETSDSPSDDSSDSSNIDSNDVSSTQLVEVMTENHVLPIPSDDSSDDFSPNESIHSNDDSVDTKSTSPSIITEKDTTSTHVTKSGSGSRSLDSLHPETITMIGKYLSMKDCMSLALTNHRCRRTVRHLLLQHFLTLAIDDGDLSRVKKLLKDGAIVHMNISKKDNCLDHPLVRVAARGQLRITQTFLNELQQERHGVSLEQRKRLETAAFVTASGEGAEELVEYFLLMRQDTVNVNCVFNEKTALSTAVVRNQADVVDLLIDSGACATREDLEMACRAGFAGVAAPILCKYPDLLFSRSNQFLHELHARINETIVGSKEELKESREKREEYMRAYDPEPIV